LDFFAVAEYSSLSVQRVTCFEGEELSALHGSDHQGEVVLANEAAEQDFRAILRRAKRGAFLMDQGGGERTKKN